MSQFPTISPVSNTGPDDTDSSLIPFNTDSDDDGIPDVHEFLFSDNLTFSAVDGRLVTMNGLNSSSPHADEDTDRDGLNNTEEYCWPYPDNCNDPAI